MYHSMIALWPTIAAISVGLMTGIYFTCSGSYAPSIVWTP